VGWGGWRKGVGIFFFSLFAFCGSFSMEIFFSMQAIIFNENNFSMEVVLSNESSFSMQIIFSMQAIFQCK
jgi:hypothetical protein